MTIQVDILKQLNRSGYPFQLRIECEVQSTQHEHGWSVASREHPWTSIDTKSSGFIDIVLTHKDSSTFPLVLECKRIKADDGRQLNWLFLLPNKASKPTSLTSCLQVEARINQSDQNPQWEDVRIWDDVSLNPESLEAGFCVLPSDEQRKSPILESLATEVLQSIEGLAHEELGIERSKGGQHSRLFIFPAIVTNANITVCRFNPELIKIKDGTLDTCNAEIETLPFIRFRKSMATAFPQGPVKDLRAANRARQRTVFVVTATHIAQFLKDWRMKPLDEFRGYGIQKC
jgi:hypothetical protein